MKYLIRSVKYFVMYIVLFSFFIVVFSVASPDISIAEAFAFDGRMFAEGSLPKIIVLFLAIAIIYPAMGFIKKEAVIGCSFDEGRNRIVGAFENAGFILENEDNEKMTFRLKSGFSRLTRMYEDAITITKGENPLIIQGYRRDVFRLARAIEYVTKPAEE